MLTQHVFFTIMKSYIHLVVNNFFKKENIQNVGSWKVMWKMNKLWNKIKHASDKKSAKS